MSGLKGDMAKHHLGRLRKLRRMSAQEVSYRLRERLRSQCDRIRFHLRIDAPSDREFLSLFPAAGEGEWSEEGATVPNSDSIKTYLQKRAAPRFYLPSDDRGRERMRSLIAENHPEWIRKAVGDADQICRHTVSLLGYGDIQLGNEINWHRDPITDRVWPRRFWADYDLVRENGAGDPKTIHELNRHQYLTRLAKAYFLTGEERYAREAMAQIEGWIDQNPPGLGVNWHSSLEMSLRAVSWLWVLFFLLPAKSFDSASARVMLKSLFAQLAHIYRYPSCFSSPNTHLLGEATALFLGGIVFQDLAPARGWLRKGAELLCQEMERQVSVEGVHAEFSLYYHCYAVDFYLQAAVLAQRNGFFLPRRVWDGLPRMIEFLMYATRPDGSIPMIGDDDGGRALTLCQDNYRRFCDALSSGAVLFGREDFKHQARDFHEETLWLLGERSEHEYGILGSIPPVETWRSYPGAGYFIQRSGWGPLDSHLIFDCGGLGAPTGGHGHADALSLVLFSGGQDLLVDPGTFVYNDDAGWRNFFRSTRAHNTVVVDDREQSQPGGPFAWTQEAGGKPLKHFSLPNFDYVEGAHSGYAGRLNGVVHRRAVLHVRSEYWVIVDHFEGQGPHRFDFYYHFSPETRLALDRLRAPAGSVGATAKCGEVKLELRMAAQAPLTAEVICGRTAPPQGWTSSRYGERQPANALRVGFDSVAPAGALTLVIPSPVASSAAHPAFPAETFEFRTLPGLNDRVIAGTLTHGQFEDVVIFSRDDGEIELLDFKLQGRLFWLRQRDGVLQRLLAIDVRSCAQGRKLLFRGCEPVPYLSLRFDKIGLRVEPRELSENLCAEFAASST